MNDFFSKPFTAGQSIFWIAGQNQLENVPGVTWWAR
jgi:hypothetical protein